MNIGSHVVSGVASEYCDSQSRNGPVAGATIIVLIPQTLQTVTCFDPSLNHLHVNITTDVFI